MLPAEQPQTTLQTETRPHVCVWAFGEATSLPDRCSITIQLRSTKATVSEAKQSVQKRLDYILSALHNHGVPQGNITLLKHIRQIVSTGPPQQLQQPQQQQQAAPSIVPSSGPSAIFPEPPSVAFGPPQFAYEATLCILFEDIGLAQELCAVFVEKLGDQHIAIGAPHIFYSPLESQRIRNEATSIALAEARLKAERMCRTLGAHLGPPLQLVEEPIAELVGFPQPRPASPSSNQKDPGMRQSPWLEALRTTTLSVRVRLNATFEIRTGIGTGSSRQQQRAASGRHKALDAQARSPTSPPPLDENVILAARQ